MTQNEAENKKHKHNICIVCDTFQGGGKAFLIHFIMLMQKKGYNISLFLLSKERLDLPGTTILGLNEGLEGRIKELGSVAFKKIKIFLLKFLLRIKAFFGSQIVKLWQWQLEDAIKALSDKRIVDLSFFDAVISSGELYCNYYLANNVIARKKIGYVHPNYVMANFLKEIDKPFFKKLDFIVTTSKENSNSLISVFPKYKKKIIGFPNPVDADYVTDKSREVLDLAFDKKTINIITVCRLDNMSKALDRLLLIVKKLHKDNLDFVWRVVGEGYYRKNMEDFIRDNRLEKHIELLGYKDNPIPYVKKSDLFVLQSYYEGYPYSVIESLIVNTPVLVTDYPAAKEQVQNSFSGYIVKNDVDSIYNKLKELIQNRDIIGRLHSLLEKADKKRYSSLSAIEDLINFQ